MIYDLFECPNYKAFKILVTYFMNHCYDACSYTYSAASSIFFCLCCLSLSSLCSYCVFRCWMRSVIRFSYSSSSSVDSLNYIHAIGPWRTYLLNMIKYFSCIYCRIYSDILCNDKIIIPLSSSYVSITSLEARIHMSFYRLFISQF